MEDLFEELKYDIDMILYRDWEWVLRTIFGNIFRWKTYSEVLKNANEYAKNFNWFNN